MAAEEKINPSAGSQIEKLLAQLHEQTKSIGEIWHAGEADRLRNLAGQLSALADDSSSDTIREYAAELEAMLLGEEAEASAICERIEYLIVQCKKAAGSD